MNQEIPTKSQYMNRGGEVWERTETGERELFAADIIKRLDHYEQHIASLKRDLANEQANYKELASHHNKHCSCM